MGQASLQKLAVVPEQPPPKTEISQPIPSSNKAIPLPQVADQAEELDRKLAKISSHLQTKPEEIAPDAVIETQAKEIRERAQRLDSFLDGLSDILELRDELVYWRALDHRSSEQRRLLSARANELQSQILQLDEEESRWQATGNQIDDASGIEVVAARVQQELSAIKTIRLQAQEQLNQVLTLQNQLSQTGRQVSDALTRLVEAEDRFRGHLFERDSQPLWAPLRYHQLDQPFGALLRRSGDQDVRTAGEFLRGGGAGLIVLPALYFLGLIGALRLKHYCAVGPAAKLPIEAFRLLERPYSLALLAMLLGSTTQTGSAPVSITIGLYLLWLGLVFRLMPLLIKPALRPLVYPLLLLNLLELLRAAMPLPVLANRLILNLILLAALITYGLLARPSRLLALDLSKTNLALVRSATSIGLLLLAVALVANVCGLVSLSHVLGIGTLLSAFFGVAFYCAVRVLLLFLRIFLDSPWAALFPVEEQQTIAVWGPRLLIAATVFVWLTHSELYVFLIHDGLAEFLSELLAAPIGFGSLHVTLGNVITVLLIVGIGYSFAKGFSSLLRSILIARLPLQRGLPYAISKVTYYFLVLLVFAAALSSAGVELNKFTVITGALGVGVGFGLQNIVSNFASGLILLFERPIRIGDVIDVGGLVGSVRRIGARSSTLTTGQGAEVIVPNSNLLSNQVINWTLSSPWRRVEIPVGVAYGSDPEVIIQLLTAVASSIPDVMETPPPEAFFLGFGDSALNFELRFWSARQEMWFKLKSDVAIAVSRALRDAGIEIPFPQRDLRVRSVDLSTNKLEDLTRSPAATAQSNGAASNTTEALHDPTTQQSSSEVR
ncbi:Potassium efflux system KefA protein / Small-conductance mechanosensitive channel [Acidisarcina polymorpha]|uniref:Potassium efflux system KefA protein / Small-conductance mechanosensitive channel n=1 Tax=Acidisarcina polymorpha TaxID=2211140 RepID=A0A2Z5G6N2_9BACT|nr:Potassium efflux system KefA protein / Small-conductance mechanosensitive channel [Acidisarcina polymorpha]